MAKSIFIQFSPHLLDMKFSRLRIFLFTFAFGIAVVSIYARLAGYLNEIPVDLPKVESNTPIIIRVCHEPLTVEEMKQKQKNGGYTGRGINCTPAGGGG